MNTRTLTLIDTVHEVNRIKGTVPYGVACDVIDELHILYRALLQATGSAAKASRAYHVAVELIKWERQEEADKLKEEAEQERAAQSWSERDKANASIAEAATAVGCDYVVEPIEPERFPTVDYLEPVRARLDALEPLPVPPELELPEPVTFQAVEDYKTSVQAAFVLKGDVLIPDDEGNLLPLREAAGMPSCPGF